MSNAYLRHGIMRTRFNTQTPRRFIGRTHPVSTRDREVFQKILTSRNGIYTVTQTKLTSRNGLYTVTQTKLTSRNGLFTVTQTKLTSRN